MIWRKARSALLAGALSPLLVAAAAGLPEARAESLKIVTAVCSLSADPPLLLACINRSAAAHAVIRRTRCFAVNILRGEQKDLAACFSGRLGLKDVARFGHGSWMVGVTGAPFLEDGVAAFDCTVEDEFDRATHTIFIGGVRAVHLPRYATNLIYRDGSFASLPLVAAESI